MGSRLFVTEQDTINLDEKQINSLQISRLRTVAAQTGFVGGFYSSWSQPI